MSGIAEPTIAFILHRRKANYLAYSTCDHVGQASKSNLDQGPPPHHHRLYDIMIRRSCESRVPDVWFTDQYANQTSDQVSKARRIVSAHLGQAPVEAKIRVSLMSFDEGNMLWAGLLMLQWLKPY